MISLLLAAALLAPQEPDPAADLIELRGLWLDTIDDAFLARGPELAATLDFAWDHGFNSVFPVAWRPDGPLWPSLTAQTAGGVELAPKWVDTKFPSRNVLTEITVECHRAGLEVVPVVDLVMAPKLEIGKPIDALDPTLMKFTNAVVEELVSIHAIDGIAFDAHALARYKPLDTAGLQTLGDFVQTLRGIVNQYDPEIRFVLVDGGAGQIPWMERGLFDAAVVRMQARDADAWKQAAVALKAEPWCAKSPARALPFLDITGDAWTKNPDALLAAITHNRTLGLRNAVVASLTELRRDDGLLATELAREPFYGLALVPWRNGLEWRTRGDATLPQVGEGQWEWFLDSTGVRVLQTSNAGKGVASWTLRVIEKGDYDLYTWISPEMDLGSRFAYSVTTKSGVRTVTVDPTRPGSKGWIYLGSVPMDRRGVREVVKLSTNDGEPTKVTVAGPLVAVLSRKPRNR
ncbi:MAG: hypothetical protein JNL28_14730 [Planctomycetes bacterium]|nr:hypothetical protein [Planctomycetota bacterium]